MADSIASLPAMPSKSVPGTPFGLSGGIGGVRRSGTSPNVSDGLSQSQRGFSNPDLARAFGKPQPPFPMDQPRVRGDVAYTEYCADPYSLTVEIPSTPCSTLDPALSRPTDRDLSTSKPGPTTRTVSRMMVTVPELFTPVDPWA